MHSATPQQLKINQRSEDTFRGIFDDLLTRGKVCAPRGQKVIELENYSYTLAPRVRFCNFEARKLNENYIKHEFLWYLRGDKFDVEILDHAKMWTDLVNYDGSINSNYGQYIFTKKPGQPRNQFANVVKTLSDDQDSRRASIMILNREHLMSSTRDYPCTYSLNFRIRENKLKMTVHMRSQDAVFGMGNDAPCFSFVHEMVYVALQAVYNDLELGEYHHVADSFHAYERHFEVIEKIARASDLYVPLPCPEIENHKEVNFLRTLIHLTYGREDLAPLPKPLVKSVAEFPELTELVHERANTYNFSRWLTTFTPQEIK